MVEVVSKAASVSMDGSPLSSPSCSTDSSFRELDDVFLQTQAKIWIGEILQTRLNEELNIADLLSNGELLYEVSREIWSTLATKRMELRGLRPEKYDPFVSKKSSGRYRPYSNVDVFLKVCKILGVTDIDLFSPSDAVEKRNTRKVCMCIRSLSRKVRSIQLNVPDFDIVTYTVAMPTDMVGYIRRSWEMSHCSPSSSAASSCHSSYRNSQRSRGQNLSLADSASKYDTYNEESDEADSDLMFQSDSQTSSFSHNTSSCVDSELLDSHEVSSVPKDYACERCSSNNLKQKGEYNECFCEAESLVKSMDLSQNLKCDHQEHSTSFPSFDLNAQFESVIPQALDTRFVDSNIEDNASVVGNSDGNTPIRNEFGGQSDLSIFTFDGTYRNGNTLLHEEDDNCRSCANTGSCASKTFLVNLDHECKSRTSDVDNMDASSAVSMSSTSDPVLKLDGNDHVHAEEHFRNSSLDETSYVKSDSAKSSTEESKFQAKIDHGTQEHGLTLVSDDASMFDMQVCGKHCEPVLHTQYTDGYLDCISSDKTGIFLSQMNSDAVYEESYKLINDQSQVGFHQEDMKENDYIQADNDANGVNGDDNNHEKFQDLAAKEEKSEEKLQKRQLIKSVASGTAVLGAVLLLIQIRKNGGQKTGKSDKQSTQTRKSNSRDISLQKGRKKNRSNRVYPSEKLKFGK